MAPRHPAHAQRREDLRDLLRIGEDQSGSEGRYVHPERQDHDVAAGKVKGAVDTSSLEARYRAREARSWWRRAIEPPAPFVMNPRERRDFPLGRWNLYIGGAGRHVAGYVNLDIACVPGVDVAADAHVLPFRDALFQRVECDAVLEHVRDPGRVMREIRRVL